MALFGAAKAKKRLGNRIVTTVIEHESVLESAKELEKQGNRPVFSIIRNDIPVSRYALRHILLLL